MIRPFKNTDRKKLLEIFKLNTPKYFNPNELNDFKEYLKGHSNTYLTIEHEGKIVGGAGYRVEESDKSGRITWIFLHPGYSGLGLGTQAMAYCLTILKTQPKVEKLVVTTSQLAYKFFERFGYKLVKKEKDHWGPGLDLYVMEQMVNERICF